MKDDYSPFCKCRECNPVYQAGANLDTNSEMNSMSFDKRIVALYSLMSMIWLGYAIYNVLYCNWIVLPVCLAMIAIDAWMAYPSMLVLVKEERVSK